MSSLSRNSCAKAFGNWSRGENFRPKKPRGCSTNPPPASLRVKASPLNWYYFIATLWWNTVVMLLQIMPPILHTHKWRTFCSIAKKKWPLLFLWIWCLFGVPPNWFSKYSVQIMCESVPVANTPPPGKLRAFVAQWISVGQAFRSL